MLSEYIDEGQECDISMYIQIKSAIRRENFSPSSHRNYNRFAFCLYVYFFSFFGNVLLLSVVSYVCLSVCRSVFLSIGRSVGLSVSRSVYLLL